MTDNVERFPKTTWERIKNRRGPGAAHCIVSGRYLKFGKAEDPNLAEGPVMVVDVMTDTDSELPDRKLCELILPVDELRQILERAAKQLADTGPKE